MKTAVVIQGPTTHYSLMKKMWFSEKTDLIWSTWKGEEEKYTSEDKVLFSDIPSQSGTRNLNMQKISTLKGLEYALDLGYDFAIKTRSDLHPTNVDGFIHLIQNSNECINTLFFVKNNSYYTDYLYAGKIKDLIEIFSFDDIYPPFAEYPITQKMNCSGFEINLLGGHLTPECDLKWVKNNISLSNYKKNSNYSW